MITGQVVQHQTRRRAEQHVRCPRGVCRGQPACQVAAGNLFVDRVGLDMLVENKVASDPYPRRRNPLPYSRFGIEDVISKAARCPTIAPTRRRCNPMPELTDYLRFHPGLGGGDRG